MAEADEVTLLHSGAYAVVEAGDSQELTGARLRTMYHYVLEHRPSITPYHFKNVTVHPDHHEVLVDGRAVRVTRTEFRLLLLLAQHPEELHGKDVLAELLGEGGGPRLSPHALESHISRLRHKISSAGGPRLIESVRGSGYRLRRPA